GFGLADGVGCPPVPRSTLDRMAWLRSPSTRIPGPLFAKTLLEQLSKGRSEGQNRLPSVAGVTKSWHHHRVSGLENDVLFAVFSFNHFFVVKMQPVLLVVSTQDVDILAAREFIKTPGPSGQLPNR